MSTASRPLSHGLPFSGIAFLLVTVLGFLFAAERSGLPPVWAGTAAFTVLAAVLGASVWMTRTAMEPLFFGQERIGGSVFGGIILGLALTAAHFTTYGGVDASLWLAALAGTVAGLAVAHLFLRLRNVRLLEGLTSRSGSRAFHTVLGVALMLMGGVIAMYALQGALNEIETVFAVKGGTSVFIALILPFFALLLGGCYGGLSVSGMLALLALTALSVMMAVGFTAFGAPPLPGLSDSQTLAVIAELRAKWGLTGIAFLEQWPPLAAVFKTSHLPTVIGSAVVAAAIALTLSPAIAVRRRSVTLTAIVTASLLPLLLIAAGGYAIEAAAKQFVGAPINRPPPGLLEAARLGLVSVCSGNPETPDALGRLCGVSPRDAALLTVEQLRFHTAFLQNGLSVALGSSSVINAVARIASLAMAGTALVIGLWLMAVGLGNHILGRKHQAAGLASQRLAVTRMAAVIAIAFAACASIYGLMPSLDQARVLTAGAALIVVLMRVFQVWHERKEMLSSSLSRDAAEKRSGPAKSRRIKAERSAPGKPA